MFDDKFYMDLRNLFCFFLNYQQYLLNFKNDNLVLYF